MVDTKSKKQETSKKAVVAVESSKVKKTEGGISASKSQQVKKNIENPQSLSSKEGNEVIAKSKASMITIKQVGSPIRRDPRQKLYLKSLGLGKLNRSRKIVDNASTRGLLNKLQHMVVVFEQ